MTREDAAKELAGGALRPVGPVVRDLLREWTTGRSERLRLPWDAVKNAHALSLVLDADGVEFADGEGGLEIWLRRT